ncbi:TPA: 4Fe-4S ferredoxin [Candidatus Sumerlaeota bacterium]|jgi:Pyruvate/2-oxoacid:ferredoxin oxidoreductase delta subunit|nr:4Fe-4S ferredoxin [Candidatus Sumerlaeota bacterium]
MKRKIVKIDEAKCNGCGQCVPSCAEGAIQIIEGKARLVKEIYCDGLGACLGKCPLDAISVEEREAEEFNEDAAMRHVAKLKATEAPPKSTKLPCGCPGSMAQSFAKTTPATPAANTTETPSELTHWPVQLTLVAPNAPFFQDADLVLAADCAPFAYSDFHRKFLSGGRALTVGCPKLDDSDAYVEKLTAILTHSNIRSLTIARMEVPCCGGLSRIAQLALEKSGKNIPVHEVVLGIRGGIKYEN